MREVGAHLAGGDQAHQKETETMKPGIAAVPLVAIIAVGLIGLALWHSVNYVIDKVWKVTPQEK